MPTPAASGRANASTPERQRPLAEVCDLYFPGVSPCALRWMIKRRGYAHSRWGREYRLTDSQIAAIQDDMARPARSVQPPPRRTTARQPIAAAPPPARAATAASRPSRRALPRTDVKRALAEQLASPLAVTAAPAGADRGEA
jgi:hypothetical protein